VTADGRAGYHDDDSHRGDDDPSRSVGHSGLLERRPVHGRVDRPVRLESGVSLTTRSSFEFPK
jgi:hypothetical protein